jgi:hypothetical protein
MPRLFWRLGLSHVERGKHKPGLATVIERLGNPLVLILLFAASVSAFTGDPAASDRSRGAM